MTTWIFFYAACSGDVTCPAGSAPSDETCPDSASSFEDTSPPDSGSPPTRDPALPPISEEPDPLAFPDIANTVSVAVRTADTTYAGTDDNSLSICLAEDHCWKLDAEDVDDFRVGELDIHHFEGESLDRDLIDQVSILSSSGEDQWRPECLAIQLDGEPVYCADGLSDLKFGIEEDELQSWTDPQGLHLACQSCDPTGVTHGPMLGALEPDLARIWVRTDATRRVGLRLGLTADLTEAEVVAWGDPSPRDDYTLELTIDGLTSAVTYFAALEIDGVLAPDTALSFTTPLPVGTAGDTTFSFGSCSKYDDQPIFETISEDDPDLFLFLGDNHYANSDHLDSLRWYYRWSLERPERAALARKTVTLATWDDHDYVGNNTDGLEDDKDNAVRAFDEYWANRSVGSEVHGGVFHSYEWQDLAFFFLDSRYFRGFEDSLIGEVQTDWLVEAVSASNATFKFLVCGSQWTLDGSSDSWAEYPEARDDLFQALFDQGVEGLVLLSGDIHRSEFLWLEQSGGYDLLELTSSPLANSNSSCSTRDGQLFCHDEDRYYVRVDASTDAEDPWFVATLVSEAGEELESLVVKHSELRLPGAK